LDLGSSPPSNSLVPLNKLSEQEEYYPLRTLVCEHCKLVQTEDFVVASEMFTPDYAYFSSFSSTWIEHAKQFVNDMMFRCSLNKSSFVVEIASNDGYLLQFVDQNGIPCLGIEPTDETAAVAVDKGLNVINEFFSNNLGQKIANEYGRADLIVANNVLAHVPEPLDLLKGIEALLKKDGLASIEFHSFKELIDKVAIDTIYHEHFSYYSLISFQSLANSAGLKVVDVEKLSTHGGSLRVYLSRKVSSQSLSPAVQAQLDEEVAIGLREMSTYNEFSKKVDGLKISYIDFLNSLKDKGVKVAGYGAAAKASTLLNYANIQANLMPMIADKSPSKIGKYVPGCRVPIVDIEALVKFNPDVVVIFPWNIKDEVIKELTLRLKSSVAFYKFVPEITKL
tara:strand:- start:2326 stop:3507 length:1182 start_codon:yes stop_codon:yes gene_type:complete